MERQERIRRRDLGARAIRRGTGWAAAAALAAAAGLATLFGIQHTEPASGAAGSGSDTTTTTNGGSDDSAGSTGSDDRGQDGLSQPGQAPDSSSGNGSVTSGGS